MERIEVKVTLYFTRDGIDPVQSANIEPTPVPWTYIQESLGRAAQGLARQLLGQAELDGMKTEEEKLLYLQGMLSLDQEKLKSLFK